MKLFKQILAASVLLAILMLPLVVMAQSGPITYSPNTQALFSNTVVEIQGTNTLTNVVAAVPVKLGYPIGLEATAIAGTATNTSPFTVGLDVSVDGTRWTTTQPLRFRFSALNGTTKAVDWTNIAAAYVDNIRYVKVGGLWPQSTNGFHLTNVWITHKY